MSQRPRRSRRAVAAPVIGVLAMVGALFFVTAAPSQAVIVPTVTTLTSSDNPALEGTSTVRLTATVSLLVPTLNLGPITPSGTVTFARDGDPIGSAPLGGCLLNTTPCTASVDVYVGDLEVPPDTVYGEATFTATFTGDFLSTSSSGSVVQRVVEPQTCFSLRYGCDGISGSAANGTAEASIKVIGTGLEEDTNTPVPVEMSFTSTPSPCTRPGTGDGVIFDVGAGAAKQIEFRTYNAAAEAAKSDVNRVCWESPTPFTTAGGGSATPVFPGTFGGFSGTYYGLLPMCAVDGPSPCIVSSTYFPASTPPCDCDLRSRIVTVILAPGGDPKTTR